MYSGGSGTEQDPYIIKTAQDLIDIENNLSAYFLMISDIDLSSYSDWTPIGYSVGIFSGVFNGLGNVIDNMTFSSNHGDTSGVYYGLFEKISGTVKNLGFTNVSANDSGSDFRSFGTVCGDQNGGLIERCWAVGSATILATNDQTNIGGIAGESSGEIKNCWTDITIYSNQTTRDRITMVGGIVGQSNDCLVEKCYAKGKISAGGNPDTTFIATTACGGIVGGSSQSIYSGTVRYCVAKMSEIKNLRVEEFVHFKRITNNFKPLSFTGPYNMSYNDNYALDSMITPNVLVSDKDGLDGLNKTASELQQQSTYEALGWDFDNIWIMESGEPKLRDVFEINTKGALFFGTNF